MKKIILVFQLSFLYTFAYTQSQSFVVKAIDAKGQTDSVIIGYRENASVGIDESLAEVDYYGEPYSEIDIRSIQRNTILQNSLWLGGCGLNSVEPFQQNIDLKKDYRQYLTCGNHFIIQVYVKNYPVTIMVNHLFFEQDVPFNSYLKNGDCGTMLGELRNFSVHVFNDSTENQIIGFHPQVIDGCNTGINELVLPTRLIVYPNPTKDVLNIKLLTFEMQTAYIYNSQGEEIDSFYMQNIEHKLDISNYKIGIYLIRIGSEVVKFLKQ